MTSSRKVSVVEATRRDVAAAEAAIANAIESLRSAQWAHLRALEQNIVDHIRSAFTVGNRQ